MALSYGLMRHTARAELRTSLGRNARPSAERHRRLPVSAKTTRVFVANRGALSR
jgi:hypothetical protein